MCCGGWWAETEPGRLGVIEGEAPRGIEMASFTLPGRSGAS